MFDFIRFYPRDLPELGFKGYVVLTEKPRNEGYDGYLITANSVEELRNKLRRVPENRIVAVYSDNLSVCKEAVMRKKVDILADGLNRKLDYATIMLASEKDVAIELSLLKFLITRGIRRMKLFEELKDEIRIINKFDTPFIISSGATDLYGIRTKKQIEVFFKFFGADIKKAKYYAERIVRRYYDPNYIMDGFEIETVSHRFSKL